jgi:hypothetical protein
MVAGYFYMDEQLTNLSDDVASKNQIIQSNEYKQTMENIALLRSDIDSLKEVQLEAEAFKMLMTLKFPVSDDLMSDILGSIPRNVNFNSYSISSSGVQILGTSMDYTYIAELEYNLNALGIFENVFVNVISSDEEEGFSFSLSFDYGGGF